MGSWSLRTKLTAASVLVLFAATALALLGSDRMMKHLLREQAATQGREISALLNQTLAAPLAQRDYATVQQTLDLVRESQAIDYLAVHDHRGRLVAASGWDIARPLPPRDQGDPDLERDDATMHLSSPIVVAGQPIAVLDLGISSRQLRQARGEFRRSSLLIAVFALMLSVVLMMAIAKAITRHLTRLAQASQRMAEGDFEVQVSAHTTDEVGRLSANFNAMAVTIRDRVAALQQSEAQQQLHLKAARDEQARLTTLLGALSSGILFVDDQQRVLYANSTFRSLWSLPDLTAGQSMAEIVPQIRRQVVDDSRGRIDDMLNPVIDLLRTHQDLRTVDGRLVSQRVQRVAAGPGQASGRIWLHQDITLDRQTQQRAQQAFRDPLTELLNRRGLFDTLQSAIGKAADDGSTFALMFMDLDDFKHANDVAGHRAGDQLLITVARTLALELRPGEVVARLGGDEFAVLCPGLPANAVGSLARRLVKAIADIEFEASGQVLRIGCSVGVAMFPNDATGADELIACADTAMYQAKQEGKNGWRSYRSDSARSQADAARVGWNERIRAALREGRMRLHFQPVRRASDLQIAYHEALVRMVDEADPTLLISPAQFLPHAEHSGRIREIDRWVFEACVGQLAATPVSKCIAVNLSARSLDDGEFACFLRDAFQRHDVDPRRLHIELTEAAAMGEVSAARPKVSALRSIGCAVHLDDFGSGFSSFSQLRLLEVDAIKIDGSFIRDLATADSSELVVASLIQIAHSMKKTTVAKCVEDAATLDLLRRMGVDCVQGFHVGRPAERMVDNPASARLVVLDTAAQRPLAGQG